MPRTMSVIVLGQLVPSLVSSLFVRRIFVSRGMPGPPCSSGVTCRRSACLKYVPGRGERSVPDLVMCVPGSAQKPQLGLGFDSYGLLRW